MKLINLKPKRRYKHNSTFGFSPYLPAIPGEILFNLIGKSNDVRLRLIDFLTRLNNYFMQETL